MVKKSPWCNIQLNNVQLLIRTDKLQNVSQSASVSLETVCPMLNECSKCLREHGLLRMLSDSVTFLDFRMSQSSVATYCRWGGNLSDVYIEHFLTNQLVKEFWKSVHTCQSYQTLRGLFWDTAYVNWYVVFNGWGFTFGTADATLSVRHDVR